MVYKNFLSRLYVICPPVSYNFVALVQNKIQVSVNCHGRNTYHNSAGDLTPITLTCTLSTRLYAKVAFEKWRQLLTVDLGSKHNANIVRFDDQSLPNFVCRLTCKKLKI
jgi:hypothetical protein